MENNDEEKVVQTEAKQINNENVEKSTKEKGIAVKVFVNVFLLIIYAIAAYFIVRSIICIVEILAKPDEWWVVPFFSPLFAIPVYIWIIAITIAISVWLSNMGKAIKRAASKEKIESGDSNNSTNGNTNQ